MILLDFVLQYKDAILFYSAIFIIVYLFRNKLEKQASFFYLYRTKLGLNLMDRVNQRFRKFIKIYGYIGILIAYLGLIVVIYLIALSTYDILVQKPDAVGAGPALPGFKIPGSEITIPLVIGWISLFIIMVVHEFSHGVVARAYNVKVKSSGVGVLGPLPLAFVEPDEAQLIKQPHRVQHSIFAAGPFANVILGLVGIALLFGTFYAISSITTDNGYIVGVIQNESLPAFKSGLKENSTIIRINDAVITNFDSLDKALDAIKPGEELTVATRSGDEYSMIATTSPGDASKAYIGILLYREDISLKQNDFFHKIYYNLLLWFGELFWWLSFLSINIGLINLFPIFITDGARMVKLNIEHFIKNEKKAQRIWVNINIVGLILLGIMLLKFLSDLLLSVLV